jgi:LmbE family N-acetylglucosaminyl deacetylase
MPDWISRLTDGNRQRSYDPDDLAASAQDVYLAPHSDDIAFSLGHFAKARGQGRLVTVFTRSHFTLRPGLAGLSEEEVTQMRLVEERRFAGTCGLTLEDFGLAEAPLRGFAPMDHAQAEQALPALEPAILPGLLALASELPAARRPWLFAPMGMGGHLDHVILLRLIARHRKALTRRFRLAFYEDLPYAVWPDERDEGLIRFKALLGKRGWRRIAFPLGQALAGKLALLNLYESQHAEPPAISGYTPQARPLQPPHEAIWVSGRL